MHKFAFILIIVVMIMFKEASAGCENSNGFVYCDKFSSFTEINLNAENVMNITLLPDKLLVLNDDLDLSQVKVVENFKFTIKNLLGLPLNGNPFNELIRTGNFYLDDSIFQVYESGFIITPENCTYILNNDFIVTFFDFYDFVSLGKNITYPEQFCPGIFKNAYIDTIEMHQLTNDNKLQFSSVNYSDSISFLQSQIINLKIYDSTFYLEEKLLDKKVFEKINTLLIDNSNLIGIQHNLFASFFNLSRIELNLNNFNEFIKNSNKWFKHLNENNQATITLILNDLTSMYDYPESDFCFFKNFPNIDSIKPKIVTKPNLDCTCTLMWLLKNKNQYNINELNSDSTNKCLNDPNYDQLITNCKFEEKLEKCMDINAFCSFNDNLINCTNFDSFIELNFVNNTNTYNSVSLTPNQPIILDSSLDFQQIKFDKEFQANLNNLNGVEMDANPFALLGLTNGSLILDNSKLDFYFENKLIDSTLCDYINKNEIFVAFFDVFKRVSFGEQTKYPKEFCPIQFKNAKIELFEVNNMGSGNLLSFSTISVTDDSTKLNAKIDTFKINSGEIYLNDRIFYSEVFKNTQTLNIYLTILIGIDHDLFKDFYQLKYVELVLLNYNVFIQTDQTWMKYLNSNVTIDLGNQNQINDNKKNRMTLVLEDHFKVYKYPENDFCLFRNFPHNKLVFPVIKTSSNLECTCTLMWLIQYRNLYPDTAQIMNTSSVSNCLNSPTFTQMISNCKFEEKLAFCNGITTTLSPFISTTHLSTSFIPSTIVPNENENSVYKSLFISFLCITIILIIFIGAASFYLYRIRKKSKNGLIKNMELSG